MSWRDAFRAIALVPLLGLGGCFEPLYAPISGRDFAGELRGIQVMPISDRIGHYLENSLIFYFNGTGETVAPRYQLYVTIHERVDTPLVDTVSGRATAGNVLVDADYRLVAPGSDAPITQGTAFVVAGYDRSSQRFANIRAARDAEIRDAHALADQIRTRIAAALIAKPTAKP